MGEPSKCFNGGDCILTACPYFIKSIEDCGFTLLGINKGEVNPFKPIKKAPQGEALIPHGQRSWNPGETVNVTGVVKQLFDERTGKRADGTQWRMRKLVLDLDGTGEVDVALWGEFADISVSEGQRVGFEALRVREPYKGRVQLSTVRNTKMYV